MVCFDASFYFFLNTYFSLNRTDLGPVSAQIGPYWSKSKKKNRHDVRAATLTAAPVLP